MPEPPTSWEEAFWEVLCEIYKALGGDCADLPHPSKAGDVIAYLDDFYQAKGPPTFGSEEERVKFLGLLDDVEAAVSDPACTLTDAEQEQITELIARMREDLEP